MLSSTPAGFEPFPRLPFELRREIWGFASAIPRPRPGFSVLPPNPRDPVWLYSVRHIATPFPPAWVCSYMTWALKVGGLRSVESVSIVFPSTTERLDSLGGGSPPPWRWAGLRAVADAEMDEFYASPDGDGVRGGVRDDYDFGYIPAVFWRFMIDCGLQTVEDYEMQKKSSIRDQLATIVLVLKKDAAAREERGRPEVKTIAKRFDLLWGDTGVDATVAVGSR
ncbi:hypothetical protein NKR19_g4107 [Coniochaeta hoffmannii]|uniref:Uncharacterized protein n=1 Tax=Coniochaeta hoffmannii TaxID=91930 RepID=A0AA38SC06_9PEZI|nr:hypothetical protein NKR19_g4107 [Coniochaeta hoffmannii]